MHLTHKLYVHPNSASHKRIDERVSLTPHEIEDLYQSAWDAGYKAANEDMRKDHNLNIEWSQKVPKSF